MAWMKGLCACSAVLFCTSALIAADPAANSLRRSQAIEQKPTAAESAQVDRAVGQVVIDKQQKENYLQETGEWKFAFEQQQAEPKVESRAGGDTCATATVIGAIPYSDSGTTVGATDDYNEACPYTQTGGTDVVYSYTPAADVVVDISLCGNSAYDTKLYVYEDVCPAPNSGLAVVCNDDSCSTPSFPDAYVSRVVGVQLLAGHTYYIVVDGYNGSGSYTIDITGAAPFPGCPDDTMFGQGPSTPNDDWVFGIADADFPSGGTDGLRHYENYSGAAGPICSMTFWGLTLYNAGFGFQSCTENPMTFEIEFYPDNGGVPGPAACTYTVSATGIPTGQFYSGFEMLEYSVDLPSCCSLFSGWVQIQGVGGSTCWFLWGSSGNDLDPGAAHLVDSTDGTGLQPETYDLSICLQGDVEPGACCDPFTAVCTDNVDGPDCPAPNTFHSGQTCAELDPPCGGIPGACCDDVEQVCTDNVLPANCSGRHAPGETCDTMTPACGSAPGACCKTDGTCAQLPFLTCAFQGGAWQGVGTDCSVCPCVVNCPAGGVPEQDTCAGPDTNYGCLDTPESFQDIALGDTVCGTVSAILDTSRDTDWYRFTTTEPMMITVAGKGEFGGTLNLLAGLIETSLGATGTGDCNATTGFVAPYFTAGECEDGSVTTECYPAGTYMAFVSVDDFLDLPCGTNNDYTVTITGTPCTLPTGACCECEGACSIATKFECAAMGGVYQGDNTDCGTAVCPQPIDVNVPAGLPYVDTNGTCGQGNEFMDTCLGDYDGGEDIIYRLNVTAETSVQITMDPLGTTWSGITLADSCPPGATGCIATVTNSATTVRDLGCKTLAPGTYTVMIDTWPSPDCIPAFNLNIVECVPPLGRCCYDGGAACADVTELACAGLGGVWTLGTDCTNPCPTDVGEDCGTATVIPGVPYIANFDNNNYTASPPPGSCNTSSATTMQNDGWFVWTATEDCTATMTVTEGVSYDMIAAVYTGTCDLLNEEVCLDEPEPMLHSFQATAGTTYYFQIGDWGTSEGGGLTTFTFDCETDPSGECCASDDTCSVTTQSECLGAGGVWSFGGDCSPNPCSGGDDCSDPFTVTLDNAALPWSDLNFTCGRGNDYADTCLGSYDSGEDIIYELIVTEPINAQITMNPLGTTWAGIAIDDGSCPLGAGGCLGVATSSSGTADRVIGCRTYGPGTYYMMVDTFAAPNCIPQFEVTIETCEPPTAACCSPELVCLGNVTQYECEVNMGGNWYTGQDCSTFTCPILPADFCDEAVDITALPYVQPEINSGAMTDDANADPSCDSSSACGSGPANNGWWYTITPTADCTINVARSGGMDSVASLHTGPDCTSLTQVPGACVDNETTASFNLTGGTTYWILVSNWSCSSEPTAIVTVTVTGDCEFVCGDMSPPGGDGEVGLQDYLAFIDAFGTCDGDMKYNADADFDGDGCITWVDYQEWLQCYRSYVGDPTAAPPTGRNPFQTIRRPGQPDEVGPKGGLTPR